MGAASSLCHCIGNLRSGEHVSATVMLLLTAQVCLTSQPERRPPPPNIPQAFLVAETSLLGWLSLPRADLRTFISLVGPLSPTAGRQDHEGQRNVILGALKALT